MYKALIGRELENACYRRPTKRMALQLALILEQDRVRPWDLVRAQELMRELSERVERAKGHCHVNQKWADLGATL